MFPFLILPTEKAQTVLGLWPAELAFQWVELKKGTMFLRPAISKMTLISIDEKKENGILRTMTKNEAKKEIKSLVKEIEKHNHLYHTLDQPQITDYEFDQLYNKLLKIEKDYPELVSKNSPTQKVGGTVLEGFKKIKHKEPMLSLQNTYSAEEIIEFEKKIQKQLNLSEPIEFFCSPKFDGVAIELVYLNGNLTHAITRGDGSVGEDVLSNVKTIATLPQKLNGSYPPRIDVRGEILLFKKDFSEINEQQQEKGLSPFANPRNAAAGSLRQLDSKVVEERNLKIFCYSLGFSEGIDFNSQESFEDKIKDYNLPVTPRSKKSITKNELSSVRLGAKEVIKYYEEIEKLRDQLDFEIDGIVVKVNSFSLQKSLGFIARSPRWAFAAKFKPQQAQTLIENIVVQVGRTGALTPVAIMTPVSVGGVTISNATLHNQDEIDRKDIRIGDTVIIHRAGDVIPEVLSVLISKRKAGSVPYLISDKCPSCNEVAQQLEGEVIKRCVNPLCPSIMIESLKHFVSRNAMNIDKLGARLIEVFFEKKIVTTFSDLYKLSEKDILNLERQGEKSTFNLINSIEKSKKTTLNRFIYALGIRFVGEQTARLLAEHFKTIENFLNADLQSLIALPEVGPKVADSIMQSLSQKKFQIEVLKLVDLGIEIEVIKTSPLDDKAALKGLSFVVTGTLPIPRNEAQDIIRKSGGQVMSAVSKNTQVLVAGENAGSKLEKAQRLGIEIWSWEELQNKLT